MRGLLVFGRCARRFRQSPILKMKVARHAFCQPLFVRNQQQGGGAFAVQCQQQIQNVIGVLAIQIPRRLIGKQHGGIGRQRPRNGHPLLLTAREVCRQMLHTLGQPHARQQPLRHLMRLLARCALIEQG